MKTGLSSHTEPCPPLSARLQIDLDVNLLERKTGGMGAGGGLSASAAADGGLPSCFVGSFSYSEKNLFGLNQKLSARVEMGQVCVDPWAPWVDCLCRSEGGRSIGSYHERGGCLGRCCPPAWLPWSIRPKSQYLIRY